jgi:CHAT domain-containing protein
MTVTVGAPLGVVSLWNVNDAATAELMKAFYQNLRRGLQKDEAPAHQKSTTTWRHPYFWASFVMLGERK